MRLWIKAALVLLGCAVCAGSVRADITYQYSTDAQNYSGAVGSTVTVQLYLTETLTPGTASFVAQENGLFGAGVGINRTGSTGNATISSINFNTAPLPAGFGTGGAAQNTSNVSSDGTNAGLIENTGFGTSQGAGISKTGTDSNGNTVNKILLGSAVITVGSTASTFNITDLAKNPNTVVGNQSGNTLTFTNGYDLDANGNTAGAPVNYTGADNFVNSFTVTAAAVPEPSSLLLCGLFACGGAYRAYRRRKAQKAEAVPTV